MIMFKRDQIPEGIKFPGEMKGNFVCPVPVLQGIGLVMRNVICFNYFTFKICASQLQFYACRLFEQKKPNS